MTVSISEWTFNATAEFISFFLETLCFGILTVLYALAFWIILWRSGKRWNRLAFTTATLMFILAFAHLAIDVQRAYVALVSHALLGDGATILFSDTRAPTYIAKSVIYVTQTLLGDGFMVYRIYVIWSRSWLVTSGPILLLAGSAFSGYGACYDLTKSLSTITSPWFAAFLAISTIFNFLSGALIILRISRSKRWVRRYSAVPPMSGQNVLETFIQSAAIYSVVLISLFVTYILGANPEMFGVDMLTPLIGITFTLVIIRIGLVETAAEKPRIGGAPHVIWKTRTLPQSAEDDQGALLA
ncbi:hypothetical protein C8Q74DRAFT_449799 [Fomes fomentarius]|nr:hypothetical protein C8Q74DRAFT_449799 [Fomes fomentarius]